jgi:hypothetical protein
MKRRWLSTLLVLAGIAILAAVGYEYFRGYQGQEEGRQAWEKARAAGAGTDPARAASFRQAPPIPGATPPEAENPGIQAPVPTPAAAEPRSIPIPRKADRA